MTPACLTSAAAAYAGGQSRDWFVMALLVIMETESRGGWGRYVGAGAHVGECVRHDDRNGHPTLDCGPMQINEGSWPWIAGLTGFPVDVVHQLVRDDGCFNVTAGAALLAEKLKAAKGNRREALGRYHSATPDLKAVYLANLDRAAATLGFTLD